MAHVKRAGDVWRRDDDAEDLRLRILVYLRSKKPIPLPPLIVVLLRLLRVVVFGDIHANFVLLVSLNENVESTPDKQQSSKRREVANLANSLKNAAKKGKLQL